jgi:alanyl-tRNA synthetase
MVSSFEKPTDVIKAVVSLQKNEVKKTGEQLIRDKAKGLKQELTQQIRK